MDTICFLFPAGSRRPVGGYKVVYEYANRLVRDGYKVGVVYPAYCFVFNQSAFIDFLRRCKALIRFLLWKITKQYSCRHWFKLDERVQEHWVWSLSEKYVPRADVYVATAVQTSVYLNDYKSIFSDRKFYFIQHFENWGGVSDEQVIMTYHYPMKKFVIARWLEHILVKNGEQCVLIPNGFDFDYFKQTIPICLKNKYVLSMLYHLSDWKGCSDGFHALNIVKQRYPNIQVNIFGVPPRPKELPDWYHYYQQPDRATHNRIYNESAIFIGTSWSEGWGLTLGEAMICGCAVACTDNLGYLEMATDNETALVSPVKNPEALAANIIRLIEDDALRYRIAEAGNRNIRRFSWEKAYGKMKEILSKNV